MKVTSYDVATQVISSQAQAIQTQLAAPANADRVKALVDFGVDGPKFIKELAAASTELVTTEVAHQGGAGVGAQGLAAARQAAPCR